MAKSPGRDLVWLQYTETREQNHRISTDTRDGLPEPMRDEDRQYRPHLLRHTVHKLKRE